MAAFYCIASSPNSTVNKDATASVVTLLQCAVFDPAALPSVPLAERRDLPTCPGIYFVYTSPATVLYIGSALSLNQRWVYHHRLPQLLPMPDIRLAWLPHPMVEELPGLESAFITLYRPQLNGKRVPYSPRVEPSLPYNAVLSRTAMACKTFFATAPVFMRSNH